MKKSRTLKLMNADELEKIRRLMDAGITNGSEIAKMLGIGRSTAQRYATILTAIHSNQPVPFPTTIYKQAAVEEYCRRHNLEYKSAEATDDPPEPEPRAANPRINALYDYAVVLERLGDTLRTLSASLMTIYAEEAEGK